MTTAAIFVDEAVKSRMADEPTSLEAFMAVAVMDQLPELSANEARKAVLAAMAAAAWHQVQREGS